jgi:hypothetical protein
MPFSMLERQLNVRFDRLRSPPWDHHPRGRCRVEPDFTILWIDRAATQLIRPMSRYLFQFFALLVSTVLFTLWLRRSGAQPAPVLNAFHIVRWPLALRLINAAFCVMVLAICGIFLWARLATDEKVPSVILVLAVPLVALAGWGALSARTRTEYNESTLIVFPVFGQPQRIGIRDFTRAGPISWRGHEFATDNGDKIYVNSIQTGASALIELLQRQVKETYFE